MRNALRVFFCGKVFTKELLDGVGDVAESLRPGEIVHQQVLDVNALLNHRWHDKEGESRQDGTHNDERAQNAEDAVLQMTAVLEEPDHREQDVGDEPRQEKGCEYTAQSAEQHDDAYDNDDPYQAAYELIEVDLLTKHICHFFCFLLQR